MSVVASVLGHVLRPSDAVSARGGVGSVIDAARQRVSFGLGEDRMILSLHA